MENDTHEHMGFPVLQHWYGTPQPEPLVWIESFMVQEEEEEEDWRLSELALFSLLNFVMDYLKRKGHIQ